mmetsp:Transcript_32/g.47  ORF Transcript_32/g.47 Transcript_32/m.47 type:complete len:207 (+) Transcript_32:75-695(+)
MAQGEQGLESWTVDQVIAAFVEEIGLPEDSPVIRACRENAVDGAFLIQLTDEELKEELGMTGLQVKKVKRMIEEKRRMNSPGATSTANRIEQTPAGTTYDIPAPLNVQPPPAGGAYAAATNPYMNPAPAGYSSGPAPGMAPMMGPGGYPMAQQQPYGGGGGLQAPPDSYGIGMPGPPPPMYYAPPNYQQQQYPQTSATNQRCCRVM